MRHWPGGPFPPSRGCHPPLSSLSSLALPFSRQTGGGRGSPGTSRRAAPQGSADVVPEAQQREVGEGTAAATAGGSRRRMRILWVYAAARQAEREWSCALHESRLRGRAAARYRDEGPSVHHRRVCTPAVRRPGGWAVEGATSRPAGSPPPSAEHLPLRASLVLLPRRRLRPPPQPPPTPLLSLATASQATIHW